MRIYGMMRIKNEARWIDRVIKAQLPILDRLFILDDHSTDNTVEICEGFDRVSVYRSPFDGIDESRDKNALIDRLEQVAHPGDWCLALDGDEELESGSFEKIVNLVVNPGPFDCYRFQVLYLWDRPDQIRVDRWYSNFSRPSLFMLKKGARFHSQFSAGFHCGNTAGATNIGNCSVRILHWGYMLKEDRIRKWNFYNSHDPTNTVEGYDPRYPERRSYPHIVQGDIPAVPADAVLMYAGPLELRQLSQ